MARAAYAAALLCLLLLLPLSLASSAAIEVRLGPQLFDDLAALVNAALPNVTKGILPIALPDQSKSVLNVKADIYNVSLVQLDLSPVEISILTTPGAFHVAIADIAAYVNYSLKYSIWPAPSKTIEGLQAIANIAVGVSFTITAPIPRVSIFTDTQYSSVTVTKLDLGIKDSLLLELLSPVLTDEVKKAVETDAPAVAWPAIENATAPLLAKLVDPIAIPSQLFCPAVLNASLSEPPIYTTVDTANYATLSVALTVTSPAAVCDVQASNVTWPGPPAALEAALTSGVLDCFYTTCHSYWGAMLNALAGGLHLTDDRLTIGLQLAETDAFFAFHLSQILVSLPLTISYTIGVYSNSTPFIQIPTTTTLPLNDFTAVQDDTNLTLVLLSSSVGLPSLQLEQPTLIENPALPIPSSFTASLASSDLSVLSAQASAFIASLLAPKLAGGLHANLTLPSLPFPPRGLEVTVQEGYILLSSNLATPPL